MPDMVVQLRPTYPIRDPGDIERMVGLLAQNPEADSVRCEASAISVKMGVILPVPSIRHIL